MIKMCAQGNAPHKKHTGIKQKSRNRTGLSKEAHTKQRNPIGITQESNNTAERNHTGISWESQQVNSTMGAGGRDEAGESTESHRNHKKFKNQWNHTRTSPASYKNHKNLTGATNNTGSTQESCNNHTRA